MKVNPPQADMFVQTSAPAWVPGKVEASPGAQQASASQKKTIASKLA
jgi:hypothetical protein